MTGLNLKCLMSRAEASNQRLIKGYNRCLLRRHAAQTLFNFLFFSVPFPLLARPCHSFFFLVGLFLLLLSFFQYIFFTSLTSFFNIFIFCFYIFSWLWLPLPFNSYHQSFHTNMNRAFVFEERFWMVPTRLPSHGMNQLISQLDWRPLTWIKTIINCQGESIKNSLHANIRWIPVKSHRKINIPARILDIGITKTPKDRSLNVADSRSIVIVNITIELSYDYHRRLLPSYLHQMRGCWRGWTVSSEFIKQFSIASSAFCLSNRLTFGGDRDETNNQVKSFK